MAFQCLDRTGGPDVRVSRSGVADELLRDLPEAEPRSQRDWPDDRTTLLEGLPPDEVERLLTLLTPENQRVARSLLSYGQGTVGRLMTPDFIDVQEAVDHRPGAGPRPQSRARTARRSTPCTSPTPSST